MIARTLAMKLGPAACGLILMVDALAAFPDPPAASNTPSTSGATAAAGSAEKGETPAGAPSEAAGQPGQVVIRRQRLHLRSPEKYQVSMHLEPVQTVRLAAPFDGTVKAVVHKPGEKLESGAETIRIDTTERQLLLEKAKALHKAAQLELEASRSGTGGALAQQLAEVRVQAAKAELDLAVYRLEQGSVRMPFAGEVLRVEVADGQVVRAGETLAVVGDVSALRSDIPVDRNTVRPGQTLQIKVEDRTVPAKVEAILPLAARFEPLRELLPSAASAIVQFENGDGRLRPGQTLFSPLVPREPVTEVPNACLSNVSDGTHKVQVLRDNVVRDVRIAALAPVGADRSFISGAFDPNDEVIVSASQELPDGTVVRTPRGALQEAAKPGGPGRIKLPQGEGPAEPKPAAKGGF
jgi:membrane fusion protein (multidrug efflux system)